MRTIACLLFAILLALPPARAQQALPEPSIGPAPAWVQPIVPGTPNPSLRDRPFQALLSNAQSLYGPDQNEHYAELVFLIQNSQGLQGLGSIVLPWQPSQAELIVHSVQILRGTQVIDLLAAGQRFTVLRRENNLESAMLDGVLTAVMQPEGLAVGDTLRMTFTMRQRAGALPLRAQNFLLLPPGTEIGRYQTRQIWPRAIPIRWRSRGRLEGARLRTNGSNNELIVDVANLQVPQPTPLAPLRYAFPSWLQITDFRDWAEVGAFLAPHFAQAATLPPESSLRARIADISRDHADPPGRTLAALRLVQNEVRYFALVMGDGNYLPATAEQTWTRRFGDCKGKVALLVAVLRELGVEAEPVLVNSALGDSIADRLPQLILFDHMIVRARIDGRSYWLDPTRQGDRSFDDLASSTFGWGVPVRASGSSLERLPYVPPTQPLFEQNLTYDGSSGFADRIPIRVEWIYRGELAEQMRMLLSQSGREEFVRSMRPLVADLPGDNDEVTSLDLRDDEASGAFIVTAAGRATMAWQLTPAATVRRFRFDNDVIRWMVDLDRPEGSLADAPFAFPVPTYLARTDTVLLPEGGRGFGIDGESVDEVVAGTRISRRLELSNGRATARSEIRRLEGEIPAATLRAAKARIDALGDDQAWLRSPRGMAVGGHAGTRSTAISPVPVSPAAGTVAAPTAPQLLDQGYERLQAGALDEAEADFRAAAALNPRSSRPISNRAIIQIRRRNYEAAEALLTQAEQLDATDFVIPQARGLIHVARNRPVQAVVALSRSLELEPNNLFTLIQRAGAYQQLGEFEDALADLAAILSREPDHRGALTAKARILVWRGEGNAAMAAADALVAAAPDNPIHLMRRAEFRQRLNRDGASADYAQALSLVRARLADHPSEAPGLRTLMFEILSDSGQTDDALRHIAADIAREPLNPMLLNSRCWLRATSNIQLAEALADCEAALARSPDNPAILDSRGFVKFRLGQFDAAIEDATAALSRAPTLAPALYLRGLARLRKGDRQAGEQDLTAARRLVFDIDAEYRRFGVTP